jgi:peptide/nickel transport system substrate-binding protein
VERKDGDALSYLGFNMQDPVVGRREVREAIACAIDRASILRYILTGAAHEGVSLLPPGHWASSKDGAICQYDPQRARSLIAKVVRERGAPLSLSFKTSKDPLRLRIATVIQDQLSKVGIALHIRSYDWGTFYADIKAGRFQMFGLQWVGLKMPDIFRYAFHSSMVPPQGANRGRFANPEVDRLIELAEGTEDLAAQTHIYRQIQTKLLQEIAYVPLWYNDNVVAHRRELSGYRIATDGNFDGLVDAKIKTGLRN